MAWGQADGPKLHREAQKAFNAAITALSEVPSATDQIMAHAKVRYILDLAVEMVNQWPNRQHPWSYYSPRIEEEFGPGIAP